MSEEEDYSPDAIPILQGLDKPKRDDVTMLYSDAMPEELWKTAAKMVADNENLWFIEIRDRQGNEIMVFRGPHP